jgi:hypothetical protein
MEVPLRRDIRSLGILSFGLAAIMVATTAALAATKIVDDPGRKEWHGSQIDGWTAWSSNSGAHPRILRVYVKPDGGSKTVIPLSGESFLGDIVQKGGRAGQVVVEVPRTGNIRFYDPVADSMVATPSGVNTSRKETSPRADGDHLAFVRTGSQASRLVLYTFSSGSSSNVATDMSPSQVNGNFLATFLCTAKTCNVWRYRISTGTHVKMPSAPTGRANYWPAVMHDGTMYWVQGSNYACGKNTKILRLHDGRVSTTRRFADGIEIANLEARSVGGTDQLIYTRISCSRSGRIRDTGIYEIGL